MTRSYMRIRTVYVYAISLTVLEWHIYDNTAIK